MIYDHTKDEDIERLCDDIIPIKNMSINKKAHFYAMVIDNDLMRGPIWLNFMIGVVRLFRGYSRVSAWYHFLNQMGHRDPKFLNTLIDELRRHIRYGKDKVDPTSVGGFNSNEMKIISEILITIKG